MKFIKKFFAKKKNDFSSNIKEPHNILINETLQWNQNQLT